MILPSNNSHPWQNKLTLTPSPRCPEEITGWRGVKQGGEKKKKHLDQLQKMEGVGGTGHYHVGRMQHTQDSSNTSACEGCLCPNAREGARGQDGREGGTLAPALSAPQDTGDPRGTGRLPGRIAPGGRGGDAASRREQDEPGPGAGHGATRARDCRGPPRPPASAALAHLGEGRARAASG